MKVPIMIVATRNLALREGEKSIAVPVRVHAPVVDGKVWTCEYEIVWPDETWSKQIVGADAVQALRLTLEAIGTELYLSRHHKAGNLSWPGASGGYGFPVPYNTRHLLIGNDAVFDK